MGFLDELDSLLGVETAPKKETSVENSDVPPTVDSKFSMDDSEEYDPPGPEREREPDAFQSLVDAAIREGGLDPEKESRRRYDPTKGDLVSHDWESPMVREFSCDQYKFRCRRCLKWVTVGSDQTLNEALAQQEVNPNCSAGIARDIMAS